jgi:hypothetical protein
MSTGRVECSMKRDDYEQLDIFEMERLVAGALVDDPHEQHAITLSLLATRSGLPKRRVREITEELGMQTISSDEYLLTPEIVERVREVLENPRSRT